MVTRPGNKQRTPSNSRGNSPSRIATTNTTTKSVKTHNKTFIADKVEGAKNETKDRTKISSRGSETGSIERLDENNLQRIISSYNQSQDNINVVVRVRPLNEKEKKAGEQFTLEFPGNGQIKVDGAPGGSGQKPKLFSYNVVFEPPATQEDILQYSGMKKLIEMALEGFRCTCFCYGQTGSGKTHTLTGPPGIFGLKPTPFSDDHGLVFRSFLYLFQLIKNKPDLHFVLKASYLEIYNEKVIDLLNAGSVRKPLAVRWSKKARGFFVENLFTVDCEELDDLIAVLEEGLRNRAVGKHNMNDFSSRSHTILTVHITSEHPTEDGVFISRSGKINFVDLAGSEMTKKTQSEGKTLEEANNINRSLMVLGYCIASLSDSKRKQAHIPYRDSKLTKLLADSLAGNGVTLMIACISPAKSNICETLNTLRYAARAKKIRTNPVVVMDPREALILTLKREIFVLQSENEHLRSALNVYSGSAAEDLPSGRTIVTPPHVDMEKLGQLETPKLVELVRLYVTENEVLRHETAELFQSREMLQRDHEVVCRENERLLKKLESDNNKESISGVTTRAAYSAEVLNSTDFENKISTVKRDIPQAIQKELEKRQINITKIPTTRRNGNKKNSLSQDSSKDNEHPEDTEEKKSNTQGETSSGARRFSIAQADVDIGKRREKNKHIFGSVISLSDKEDE